MKKTLSIVAAIVLTFTAGNALLANTLYASAESNSQITSENDNPWDRDSSGRYDDSSSRLTSENDDPWDRDSSGIYDDSSSMPPQKPPYYLGSVKYDDSTNTLTLYGIITKDMVWEYRNKSGCTIKHIVADSTCVMPEDCSYMFLNAESKGAADYMYFSDLETIDISKANTSYVTNMEGMFYRGGFNIYSQPPLTEINVSGIDTSSVTNMKKMFASTDVTELDVAGFDTRRVTNMEYMFGGCDKLTSIDVSAFDTSKVTRMGGMFAHCQNLTELDLSSFDTSSLETGDVGSDPSIDYGTQSMFYGCESLKTVYVSDQWKLNENVPSKGMFDIFGIGDDSSKSAALEGGNGTKWSNEHIDGEYARIDKEDQPGYFTYKKYVPGYTEYDEATDTLILHGNISKPIITGAANIVAADDCVFPSDCSYMFRKAYNEQRLDGTFADYIVNADLKNIDISKADTSNVKNMEYMFYIGGIPVGSYEDYTTINVSGIDTSNVTNMSGMFLHTNVTELDVSSFDTSKVTSMYGMFASPTLKTIYASEKFDLTNVKNTEYMFNSNNLVGGNGTKFDENKTDGEYARIDEQGKPGYFTYKANAQKPDINIPVGDVNGDITIDIEDAVLIINSVNGITPLTPEQEKAADVDGSGVVDIEDAVNIINNINGVTPEILKKYQSSTYYFKANNNWNALMDEDGDNNYSIRYRDPRVDEAAQDYINGVISFNEYSEKVDAFCKGNECDILADSISIPNATIEKLKTYGEEKINKLNEPPYSLYETINSQGEIKFNGYDAYKFDVTYEAQGEKYVGQEIYAIDKSGSDNVLYISTLVNDNIAEERAPEIQKLLDSFVIK